MNNHCGIGWGPWLSVSNKNACSSGNSGSITLLGNCLCIFQKQLTWAGLANSKELVSLGLMPPEEVGELVEVFVVLRELDRWALRLRRRLQALHSRLSRAGLDHRQAGVVVVPQVLQACASEKSSSRSSPRSCVRARRVGS